MLGIMELLLHLETLLKTKKTAQCCTDEAKSAKTDDRPEFQQMIADAKNKLFDVLIVHKVDRFSRNRYDSAIYKKALQRAGVTIEYVEQHIDGSPESIMMESMLETEYYSANLAKKTMKGLNERAISQSLMVELHLLVMIF